MWPSVVVHEHWPVSQRMIFEMADYAWSEHIITVFLACQITIKNVQSNLQSKEKQLWSGLFAHGDGSTGLMKVVFWYALPTVVQGFGANETLHFRTTTFWAQLLLGVGFVNILTFWIALVNFSANKVPYMLYRVHVWRHRKPWNCLNSLLL
jgi:hypothetical protein